MPVRQAYSHCASVGSSHLTPPCLLDSHCQNAVASFQETFTNMFYGQVLESNKAGYVFDPPPGRLKDEQLCVSNDNGAYLFILLFVFQFSFFLWTKLGLFLLFPFAFIFTSLITHICFSVIENDCSCTSRESYPPHQACVSVTCPVYSRDPFSTRLGRSSAIRSCIPSAERAPSAALHCWSIARAHTSMDPSRVSWKKKMA